MRRQEALGWWWWGCSGQSGGGGGGAKGARRRERQGWTASSRQLVIGGLALGMHAELQGVVYLAHPQTADPPPRVTPSPKTRSPRRAYAPFKCHCWRGV